jgi:hypothetical protein
VPGSWFVQKVTIDGEVYKLYASLDMPMAMESQKAYKRDYFTFLKQEPEYKGDTKIHEFLNYLVESNYIEPDEYLRNVDLGNEIWYGEGETIVNSFSLSIK